MNKKQQFLQAVQLLAPGDLFILQAAERVRDETLPQIPGGAALEFVAAMERLRQRQPKPARARRQPPSPPSAGQPLSLSQALRIKSAEYWLKLGQPESALLELEHLPQRARRHPWAQQVREATLDAARSLEQMALQE